VSRERAGRPRRRGESVRPRRRSPGGRRTSMDRRVGDLSARGKSFARRVGSLRARRRSTRRRVGYPGRGGMSIRRGVGDPSARGKSFARRVGSLRARRRSTRRRVGYPGRGGMSIRRGGDDPCPRGKSFARRVGSLRARRKSTCRRLGYPCGPGISIGRRPRHSAGREVSIGRLAGSGDHRRVGHRSRGHMRGRSCGRLAAAGPLLTVAGCGAGGPAGFSPALSSPPRCFASAADTMTPGPSRRGRSSHLRVHAGWSRCRRDSPTTSWAPTRAIPSFPRDLSCTGTESNRRHGDFQSPALPTELPVRTRSDRRRDRGAKPARRRLSSRRGSAAATEAPRAARAVPRPRPYERGRQGTFHLATRTSVPMTWFIPATTPSGNAPTYPKASAVCRFDSVSLADPSAFR
jgi:hypothetical protein